MSPIDAYALVPALIAEASDDDVGREILVTPIRYRS
jgi:hypothetical protein